MSAKIKISLIAATVAASAAGAAGEDWWYALYEGDRHVGYCHVVQSTATLGGAVVKRYTSLAEARRDKTGAFTFKRTTDIYRGDAGVLYYSSVTTEKKTTVTVKSSRGKDGFTITITTSAEGKEPKEEKIEVPATNYDVVEMEEVVPTLASVGGKREVRALDLETGKVSKGKVEYVADAELDVAGEKVSARCLEARGVFGGGRWWFDKDGVLVKVEGPTCLGKGTMVRAQALAAQKVP